MTQEEIDFVVGMLDAKIERHETILSDSGSLYLTIHWVGGGQKLFCSFKQVDDYRQSMGWQFISKDERLRKLERIATAAVAFLTHFNDGAIQLYDVDDEAEGCFDELEAAVKDGVGRTCSCGRVHLPNVANCIWCNSQTPWASELK